MTRILAVSLLFCCPRAWSAEAAAPAPLKAQDLIARLNSRGVPADMAAHLGSSLVAKMASQGQRLRVVPAAMEALDRAQWNHHGRPGMIPVGEILAELAGDPANGWRMEKLLWDATAYGLVKRVGEAPGMERTRDWLRRMTYKPDETHFSDIGELIRKMSWLFDLGQASPYPVGPVPALDEGVVGLAAQFVPIKGFELQAVPVTQRQYSAVKGYNPSFNRTNCDDGDCGDHPVESVSWDDAQKFIQRLNESQSRHVYRLPSEAEWEYSARAGRNGIEASRIGEYGWHKENSGEHTHVVGAKRANAWGLYDMLGNVSEWVQDWKGRRRLYRGASAYHFASSLRLAWRAAGIPWHTLYHVGFRLARVKR